MSFILDALRRADAERQRERGQLPDLHARSLSAGATHPTRPGPSPWVKAAVAATALLLAVLAGWQWRRADAPATPPPVAHAEPDELGAAALPAAGSASTLPSTVALAPPLRPAPTATAQAPTARPSPAVSPAPAPAPPPAPENRTEPARTPPASAPTPAPAPVAPRTSPAPDTASTAMPPLKVGGVMYADTPDSRVLVINDQVLREGESVQPGLVLEHIGPKSAKLRWKDQVVEVPY